jgi:imidazolonepropionase-like amidohydrolase
VAGPDDIRAAIREHEQRGVDVIKVMASGGMTTVGTDPFGVQFDAADLRTLVDAAHAVGLPVLAHAHSLTGIRHALAAGVDGIEHFTGLTETGISVPDEVLEAVAEAGVFVDPTLGFDRDALASMPAPLQGIAAAMKRTGLDLETAQAARLEVLQRGQTHGLQMVTGVDAGATPAKPHGIVGLALAALIEGGFSIVDAVASATAVAARACGLAQVTGRLEPGLAADILLVDGNLERDITALQRPVAVLIRGNPLTPPPN